MNHTGALAVGTIDLRYALVLGPYFFAGVAIYLYREVVRFTPPMPVLLAAIGLAMDGNPYIHLWGLVAIPYIVMVVCLRVPIRIPIWHAEAVDFPQPQTGSDPHSHT